MPGGGINAGNAARILRQTSAREIHSSVGTSKQLSNRGKQNVDRNGLKSFQAKVKELVTILAEPIN
jgi:copper homeostasis protein CutC